MMMMIRFDTRRSVRQRSFALVITLLMIALAAVVSVAFLSSTSTERITSNSFNKRARAEMAAQSGLAAALNQLAGANDFRFVTAVGDAGDPTQSKPVLVPLRYDTATGKTTLDDAAKRDLYSGGAGATITLSTTANPKATRNVGFVPVTAKINGADQEVERYAFYVDEAGSRQNLTVQSGADRIYARDPSELPFVRAAAAPAPLSPGQTQAIRDQRGLLFTPRTTNYVLSNAGEAAVPPVDEYSYAVDSAATNLTPEKKPRVNLTKLKSYLDALAVDQTAGNAKAAAVDKLLDPGEAGTEWGGGNLSILTKLGRYTPAQCKQIVANLIDYLDSDLIPTTDNVDNPTYFGVEAKANANGTVTGHPFINFVGTGLIFNRSGANGQEGGLNSTRVVVVLGIVNPWSGDTQEWNTYYAQFGDAHPLVIDITVQGSASGGHLGPNANDYFHGIFSTSEGGNQLTSYPPQIAPNGKIGPNKGFVFPTLASSGSNYATNYDILGTHGRQPPGMVFSNLGFKINKLRLKYTQNDGRVGYVQVLDNLKNVSQPADPSTVDLDHSANPSSLIYKFARGAPNKADFHLNRDPRLSFADPAINWLLSKSTENGTDPPIPQTTVNVFAGHDDNNWDFTGAAPSSTNYSWYTKPDVTASFYVKSPPKKDDSGNFPEPRFVSAGELGYLHTGIPWETLRFYVTGGEAAGKERDKELLAYVQSGTFAANDYGRIATHAGQTDPADPIPSVRGPLNVNTNKRPTLQSLFLGASEKNDSDATDKAKNGGDPNAVAIADALSTNSATTPFALPGNFLSVPEVKTITSAESRDFDREILARRVSNVVATQSTRFTIYALGEARDKIAGNIQTTSSVNLRAEVELQTDGNGKPFPKVLSTAYYLTN